MVWEFKGQEGNSHGEGKANFSNYMFAGPSLTTGAERTLSKWALPGSYLSHLVLVNPVEVSIKKIRAQVTCI